jgi:hypothetical protein
MSKLTCYKCGKVRHIATDPKCPQSKKPAQRQIFATQVINDRSELDQPDTDKPSERSEGVDNADPEPEIGNEQKEQSDSQSDNLDGSQYDEDSASHEEYDGYTVPLEDDDSDLKYI